MAERTTQGVVIKVNDYGESDKLVTLYCPQIGKLDVLAKGAKRSQKRFVNKLELFSHLDIQYNNKYRLPIITEAGLIASHLPLRQQFISYAAAALICEHIYYWTTANDGDTEIFACLLWSLSNVSTAPHKTLVLFLARLYSLLGYQPNLKSCASCGTLRQEDAPYGFRTGSGNLMCRRCSQEMRPAIPLSIPTIKLLDKAFYLPLDKLSRLKFSPDSNLKALHLFRYYGRYLLDRDLQSWAYLKPLI